MYKGSIELGRISASLKLKFNLVLRGDDNMSSPYKHQTKLINKFSMGGETYLKITPYPYITLELITANDKMEGYNPNSQITFNRYTLFGFIRQLEEFVDKYKIGNLFYYMGTPKKLYMDKNVMIENDVKITFRTHNGKSIFVAPAVLFDTENNATSEDDEGTEGATLMINNIDNFANLKFDELEFLLYELKKIDINQLTQFIITTMLLTQNMNITPLAGKSIVAPQVEENRFKTPNTLARIDSPNEIPDI